MKNKKIFFFVFALAIIMVPIYVIVSSEDILTNGAYYKFKPQAYDPMDPFRGKYLRVNYETRNIPTLDKFEAGDDAYVLIGLDPEGYAYFKEAFKYPPKKGDYLNSKIDYVEGREEFREGFASRNSNTIGSDDKGSYKSIVSIKPPANMCKYFINEDYAMPAERAFQKQREYVHIGVRIMDGEARIVDIYIKGKPILDYLRGK
ncbi:MAG: putative membrane-anchored protein [Salibacteraceae bacterium]|jgi:uncharacterized membrane-anchored protein